MGIKKLEKELKLLERSLKNSISWLDKSGIQNNSKKKKFT